MKETTSEEEFYRTTLKGVPGTHMPEYSRILSDQNVLDIMTYLKALKNKEAKTDNEN